MICEWCKQEHDGHYGSGRFCSKRCKMAFIGSKSNSNGKLTGHKPTNLNKRSLYGTWECKYCKKIFDSKRLLWIHYHKEHESFLGTPHNKGGVAWNKGLTINTDERVAKGHSKLITRYKEGNIKSFWVGKHHTEETKKHLSEMALKSPHQRICKKTMPYIKRDGTIVNLDSSYERKLAKWLDENNIEWIRPKPLQWIDSNGTMHHYFPDFYIPLKNIYLDPKNEYCFRVQKEKISYIKEHYKNVLFLTNKQLSDNYLSTILIQN